MFRIGDFSRLTNVTVKTLHHYDHMGLLKPAHVDRITGYRYYQAYQMATLNRIIALKDLGLSLEQIQKFLTDDISVDEMRGMLKLKRAELVDLIAEEEAKLGRVEARLRQIEREGRVSKHAVVVKKTELMRVLSVREVVVNIGCIKPFFQDVGVGLTKHKIESVGPWIALYHHGEFREEDVDLEAAIPVSEGVPGPVFLPGGRQMQIRHLPPRLMVTVICKMEDLSDVFRANQALCEWVAENQYRLVDGPCRELYAEAPKEGEPIVFEIQLPVEELL